MFFGGQNTKLLTYCCFLFVCLLEGGGGYVVFSYTCFVSVCFRRQTLFRGIRPAVNHLRKILVMPVDSAV